MKKLIYTLGIALALGATATAANTELQSQRPANNAKDSEVLQARSSALTFERIDNNGRKVKRGARVAEDFVGSYLWKGRNQLQGESFPNEGVLSISFNPDKAGEFLIKNLVLDETLTGYFDEATGHLVIPDQYVYTNTYYNQEVWFWNYSVKNDINDKGQPAYAFLRAPEEYPFYFTVTDEGRLRAGDTDVDRFNDDDLYYPDEELLRDVCIASLMMPNGEAGFFFLCFNIVGDRLSEFEFIDDEWTSLGKGVYTDPWFRNLWPDFNPDPWDVNIYYKKNEPGTYLLRDPYGPECPFYGEYSVGNRPGHIIFNMEDLECVVVKPMIYSITYPLTLAADEEPEDTDLYCFNEEGIYYYINGQSKTDILITIGEEKISYFDKRTNEVMINNAYFSMELDPYGASAWQNCPMNGSILMPENYMDGVDSILGENLDAPAEYYNLQGQRVMNPEKGQLLIVKRGNKATKQVIR